METNDSGFVEGESEQGGGGAGNWLRINWKMILATIVIICIGVGVYAYYENYYQPEETKEEEIVLEEEEFEEGELGEEILEEEIVEETNEESEEPEWTEEEIVGEVISFEKNEEFKGYVVTAQKGEGITHLARRALSEYLSDEVSGEDLTKEHKIYIEDYLQNRIGTEWLRLGETRSFSEDLIEEAINASKNLNDTQLENLEQFSELVPSLA